MSEGIGKSQIININLEDPNYYNLLDWKTLFDYVQSKLVNDKKNYVFLDEIQNVKDFHRAADGLFIKDNVDLYLTGSNSHFQSGQWATMISGRYIEIHILPLSFKEYNNIFDKDQDKSSLFQQYLRFSGFPYVAQMITQNNV